MSEGQKPEVRINRPLDPPAQKRIDRYGPPIKIEQHDAGQPDDDNVDGHEASHTLTDMMKDYEFFTTALINTAGRSDRDPIVEYLRHHPDLDPALLPTAVDYTDKFFEGLGQGLLLNTPVDWDRRIYCILRDGWQPCRDFIGGMVVMHRPTRFYARFGFHEMQIVDPFKLKQMRVVDKPPMVPITSFNVSSNQALTWLQPRPYPARPHVVSRNPDVKVMTEGNAVLGPPPRPEELLPKENQS